MIVQNMNVEPPPLDDSFASPSRAGWWDQRASMLHIYPQFSYHGDARIVGTPEALDALAHALLDACANGRGQCRTMCHDGEGYAVVVERTNTTGLAYARLPYFPEYGGQTEAESLAELREILASRDDGVAKLSSTATDTARHDMNTQAQAAITWLRENDTRAGALHAASIIEALLLELGH